MIVGTERYRLGLYIRFCFFFYHDNSTRNVLNITYHNNSISDLHSAITLQLYYCFVLFNTTTVPSYANHHCHHNHLLSTLEWHTSPTNSSVATTISTCTVIFTATTTTFDAITTTFSFPRMVVAQRGVIPPPKHYADSAWFKYILSCCAATTAEMGMSHGTSLSWYLVIIMIITCRTDFMRMISEGYYYNHES